MLLAAIVSTSEEVRSTRSRIRKREALTAALTELSEDEARIGVTYLSGELPQGRIGLGYATIYGIESGAAETASLTLTDVDRRLSEIAATTGKGSQALRKELLGDLFAAATAAEQAFLRALILRELRQGALETSMSEAVAAVIDAEPSTVLRAVMLSGDLATVAVAALTEGERGLDRFRLTLFRPVRPMLAQTAGDLAEALDRHSPASVEAKLDGARIQVHKDGDRVAIFTRNLREVTGNLPEIVAVVEGLTCESAILDGEAIAFDGDGRPEPFQVTMSRFGRTRDAASADTTPLTPVFFDCLYLDGDDLIDETLVARRAALERITGDANLAARVVVADADAAERFYRSVLDDGHEGVMVKSLDAPYSAGRRGAGWLKVKPAHTLDLVVLAAEWGSGRRRGLLSNLHLGARDPGTGEFVMLGKTFKGLTDEMLAWQTDRFLGLETERSGHVVHVRPEQVVEIAFDGIQVSPRYPGGMALRFARVKGYRDDKTADDADTIATVREILEGKRP